MQPLIEVQNLYKEYKNGAIVTPVLERIHFSVYKGEFVSIMGPSGSGKSTLMHILGFLDTPTSGTYLFENQAVTNFSDEQLAEFRNKKVGFVFQAFNLLPRVMVVENVALPLLYARTQLLDPKKIALEAITSVGLSHRAFYTPDQLSGGEKQRVAIARALVNNPEIIFADEPTGNLDSKSGAQIMNIFQKLNNAGHTIILVTHERTTAQYAKRMIQMKDGQILSDEPIFLQRRAEKVDELSK